VKDISESELTAIEERAKSQKGVQDPLLCQVYAAQAIQDVEALLGEVERLRAQTGGELGRVLRDAVREQIVSGNLQAQQTARWGHVELRGVSLHLAQGGETFVDVRLVCR
jgi:hypothetical protein